MAAAGQLDPPHVRRVLLGLEGPYADPRVATDALDNVDVLVASLPSGGRAVLAGSLLLLVLDDDSVVATGAVLALDRVRDEVDVDEIARLVGAPIAALDRPPLGFASARWPTLRGELAVLLARSLAVGDARHAEALLAAPPEGVGRDELVGELARRVPALVVTHATSWVGPDDSGVLVALASLADRLAVARAVRRWTPAAVDRVRSAAAWRHWTDADLDALVAAMGHTG